MSRFNTFFRISICGLLILLTSLAGFAEVKKGRKNKTNKSKITPREFVVELTAAVRADPPQIALSWSPAATGDYHVFRRVMGETAWSAKPVAVLESSATGFTDTKVKPGQIYEYCVDRVSSDYVARGYICSGIEVAPPQDRGTVLLLAEKGIAGKVKLELQRFMGDLRGDGWRVIRHDIAATASPAEVKQVIQQEYRKNPATLTTVILLGHIPVPYSGNIFPDGHGNHRGAWPADLFYADIDDAAWSDTVDYEKGKAKQKGYAFVHDRLKNRAGDGKFDPDYLPPGSVELQVGRIDLADMPAFRAPEADLIKQYLDKDHAFRHGLIDFDKKAFVDDNFHFFRGESFSSSAWRSFSPLFSPDNVTTQDWFADDDSSLYRWGYGCGGGGRERAGGVGSSQDFASKNPRAAFTMLFGSFFGDWDTENCFLRAPLAASSGLTCSWSGRPHWFYHHMGMGLPIGYSHLRTQNNHFQRDYRPSEVVHKPKKREPAAVEEKLEKARISFHNMVHVALMGDPTLRLYPVKPVKNLTASVRDDQVSLNWEAGEKGIKGYEVYVAETLDGPFSCLTSEPIDRTAFVVPKQQSGPTVCMVKAVKLEKTPSGTFLNSSQGAYVQVAANGKTNVRPTVQAEPTRLTLREDESGKVKLTASDPDGDNVFFSVSQPPLHGVLAFAGNRDELVYSPTENYYGKDGFQVIASDGIQDSNPVSVGVEVTPVNDPPTAENIDVAFSDSRPVKIPLKATDPDDKSLSFRIVTPPTSGKVEVDGSEITYIPDNMDLPKKATFQYVASDGKLTSEKATVTIHPWHWCEEIEKKVTVDGKLDDWPALPFSCDNPPNYFARNRKSWKGPEDGFFMFNVGCDDAYLYIAVQVIDEEIIAEKDRWPWSQDGIEIRVNARDEQTRNKSRGRAEMVEDMLFGMSPNQDAEHPWIHKPEKLPKGSRYACVVNDKGYAAEIAIPRSWLDQQYNKTRTRKAGDSDAKTVSQWDGFRLNIAVDDKDKDGLVQFGLHPDWRNSRNYVASGAFRRRR